MHHRTSLILLVILVMAFSHLKAQVLGGDMMRWHAISLTFDGPNTSEDASPNPFADFNMKVTFTHAVSGTSFTIPGYYAACGEAAETSCTSGDKWRVHFSPGETGVWMWSASFTQGTDVAVNGGGSSAGFFDGASGGFNVLESDKTGRDNRSPQKGRLQYVGQHYLRYSGTNPAAPNGKWFIKGGPDAPENMLSYEDFDEVPNPKKTWQPHQQDYLASDAQDYTWASGKGTEMLGMIRYLSDIKQMNAFSFLTFSLDGDDKTVSPHLTSSGSGDSWNNVHHDRFDVSRMAQWDRIFAYGDKKGMFLHFKMQETENDQKMDGGNVGRERKIYYRELIARFGHHLALNWNLGEENTQTTAQILDMIEYFTENDPYQHLVVIHTYPGQKNSVYTPLLGDNSLLTGVSLQSQINNVHEDALEWVKKSADAGRPWVVANDEQGSANIGVHVDPNERKKVREQVIWGALMAGASGFEFYYGYQSGCSDLNCQDHRTRDEKYTDARYAISFFQEYLMPYLPQVENADQEATNGDVYLLRSTDKKVYVVYLPDGGSTSINGLPGQNDLLRWYNPRTGQMGPDEPLSGNDITAPDTEDWVALITASGNTFPVEWLDFTATQTGLQTVTLDWTTASESNNVGFNIERSVDGVSFEKIGHLEGAGNSSERQAYRFIDQKAQASSLYYLIEQVDVDGVVSYSEIRNVQLEASFEPRIYLYPNPASEHLIVIIKADPADSYSLRLMDMQGKTVYESKKELAGEEIQIAISAIPDGMYALVLTNQLTEEMISAYFIKN